MAEAEDIAERRAKRMRRLARILTLIWAGSLTISFPATSYLLLGLGFGVQSLNEWIATFGLGSVLTIVMMVLAPWAITVVAWRWEAVGGLLLVVVGLVGSAAMCGWSSSVVNSPGGPLEPSIGGQLGWAILAVPCLPFFLLSLGSCIPALGGGLLFLSRWWESRGAEPPQDAE